MLYFSIMKSFIVLDLEWNQSAGGKGTSVEHLPFEIFEIGAVKLDENRKKIGEFHRLVKPCVYREMHHIISEVTHVNAEELEKNGEFFPAVAGEFLEWCGEDPIFCTSGTWFIMEWSCRFPSPFYFMMYKSSTASFIQMGRAGSP